MVNPYHELKVIHGSIRTFSKDVNEEELVWHRDKEKRRIIVLEGYDWKLQFDNQEPMQLMEQHSYSIPAMEYHRILKGEGDLVLRIYDGQ